MFDKITFGEEVSFWVINKNGDILGFGNGFMEFVDERGFHIWLEHKDWHKDFINYRYTILQGDCTLIEQLD
jgi:hypothetical protein